MTTRPEAGRAMAKAVRERVGWTSDLTAWERAAKDYDEARGNEVKEAVPIAYLLSSATTEQLLEALKGRPDVSIEETEKSGWLDTTIKHSDILPEPPKRTPKVGEFWRDVDSQTVGRIESEAGGEHWWVNFLHATRCFGLPDDDMEFIADARKEGEFRVGDEVSFYGAIGRVVSVSKEVFNGVRVVFDEDMEGELWDFSPSRLSLVTPVEMMA